MSATNTLSKIELLARIQRSWDDLNAYLQTLNPEQLAERTDAAGWTVKDHIIHLAMWEDGIRALLQKQPRHEAMGISKELWVNGDHDQVNAAIQTQHQDMPLDEVFKTSHTIHQRLVETLQALSDEDLQRPYNFYDPELKRRRAPVIRWIEGNTFRHYRQHKPWIAAIAE